MDKKRLNHSSIVQIDAGTFIGMAALRSSLGGRQGGGGGRGQERRRKEIRGQNRKEPQHYKTTKNSRALYLRRKAKPNPVLMRKID